MDSEKELKKKFDELFWMVLNEESSKLKIEDQEYARLNKVCQGITGSSSKLQSVIETNTITSLTEEEVKNLVLYYESCIDRMVIEQRKMFYAGGKYFYLVLKETKIIG